MFISALQDLVLSGGKLLTPTQNESGSFGSGAGVAGTSRAKAPMRRIVGLMICVPNELFRTRLQKKEGGRGREN